MRKMLKKAACFVLISSIIIAMFSFSAFAVTGRTSISCSNTNPTVGDTITVTVNYSASNTVNAAEGVLTFSSTKLEYVSGSNTNLTGDGTVMLVNMVNGDSFSFSLSFKVKESGTAEIIVDGCKVADGTGEYSLTGSSVKLVVLSGDEGITSQGPSSSSQVELSSNADLKSITVAAGTLTPAFSSKVTEYTVMVPYDKTDGILSCKTADSNARLAFGGSRELAVGLTKRTITVTAQDGTKKVYTVTFNRLDENGRDTTAQEPDTNIEVIYNGVKYFITSDFADAELPDGFSVGVYKYGEEEVSCIKDRSGKINVLCLISEESKEKKFFIYDEEKGFSEFKYIEMNGETYVLLEIDDSAALPESYTTKSVEVAQFNVTGYVSSRQELKDFVVIKALGPDGAESFYRYDTIQKTFQRYPDFNLSTVVADTQPEEIPSSKKLIVIVLTLLAIELVLAVIIISIILIIKSIKKKDEDNNFEDYEVEEDQEDDFENGVGGAWIKSPEEDNE